MESILVEWDAFAKTLRPLSRGASPRLLRDHAVEILNTIGHDLSTHQTTAEQSEKSKGHAPLRPDADETAAQTHAVLRARSGIDINQLAAEYRALRASVLRLWEESTTPSAEGFRDMTRFNEAIDQALAESISYFNTQVERSRDFLLGMLGHDMRNPLNAIVMTAESLKQMDLGDDVSEAAATLLRSGASMKSLLNDLMDFNRTKLGLGIHIEVAQVDLGALLAEELQQHRAVHPRLRVELTVKGDVHGRWDGRRLQQVLRNLVSNAVAYGAKEKPLRVSVRGLEKEVQLQVSNGGTPIPPEAMERLFDPLQRGDEENRGSNQEGMGLGLYIVQEITRAHGGEVELRSDATETVFTVHLPRRPQG